MNEIPYASLEEDVSSMNGDKRGRKWTRKQKAFGVAFIILLIIVTAGVVVGICTKGNSDVPTPTSTPISAATKASLPTIAATTQRTTVTPETIETERTTVTLSTTVVPKTTPARKTTVTTKTAGTTPETSRSWSALETSRVWSTPMSTVSSTSPNKTESSCEDGSNIIFFISYRTVGKLLETRTAKSMSECTHHCAQSKDCAMLEHYNTTCNFYEEGSIHTPELRWALTKACVKSDQVCPSYFQFIVFEQSSLRESVGEMVPAEKIEDCFAACLNANDTSGFECRSAQFYPLDKECFRNTDEQEKMGTTNLINITETTSIYMINTCAYFSDENGIIPCSEDATPGFIRAPNMRLVGFTFHVKLDSRNVAECLHLCEDTNEEHDDRYVCKSVMYYYNEKECILNSETRESKPDLFIPESEEIKVDYFDVTRHINNKTCERSTRTRQEVHPEAWTKLRHEDEHSAECVCISSERVNEYDE